MIVLQSGEYVTMLTRKMAALIFVLTFFDSLVSWVECATQAEIDQHLNLGMQMLTRGQYSDALSHFHAAVDADPNNYMSYYKRATVFLALSRSRPALADLDKVIQLKSDFGKARLQRGSVLLKMGRLDEAHIELEKLLSKDPSNEEASKMYIIIEPLQKAINEVQDFLLYKNYQPALDRLTEIVEHIPWDSTIREMRADAYLGAGNTMNAISEMRAMTKLTNDDTEGFFKLSTMHYQLGEGEESLQQVRECLKLDPEHKDCYPFYKKVKKVAKFITAAQEAQDSQDWQECITAANKVLKNEPKIEAIKFHGYDKLCHCHLQEGVELDLSSENCNAALRIQEEPRILCDRAEVFLTEEMYDEAVNDYRRALELNEDFGRAKEGLQTAQKRQKQASKRDYYKILGVRRNAGKKEISKAYRKLAQKWHPDNFQDEDDKKKAEKKFMDIAAAKEVLSDKEMRQKFDQGEDPLDAEQERERQSRGGHPFHGFHRQGGHPGGGNGGQFKFHFN